MVFIPEVSNIILDNIGGKLVYSESLAPLWWNWYTRQVEGLCLNGHAGSSPVGGIKKGRDYGLFCAVTSPLLPFLPEQG